MNKLKIRVEYPVTYQRSIKKELNIEKFKSNIEKEVIHHIEYFGKENINKAKLRTIIQAYEHNLYKIYKEELYSEDDDINCIDNWYLETEFVDIDELVEYFSYLIEE